MLCCVLLQGKGAVGRFFSELAHSDPQASPAAAGTGYAGSPLGGAAAAAGTPGGVGSSGPSAAGAALLARQGSVPLAREKLLPSEEGFDPETYLAIFHGESSAPQLAAGVRALERVSRLEIGGGGVRGAGVQPVQQGLGGGRGCRRWNG